MLDANELENPPKSLFEWDQYNLEHIAEHSVSPEEAEQVLLNDPLDFGFDADLNGEERWTYLGETNHGRLLKVVITMRSDKMRVVTCFDSELRDKILYLKVKAGWNDNIETS